jgi:catechol 2,3-dioxygenase-like lactoylglutathione lyase family enzyme
MIGHLGVNVTDLQRSKAYYDNLMPLLEFEPFLSHDDQFAYRPANEKPGTYLFFYPARENSVFSRDQVGLQHLAFIVRSRVLVHQVYDAVLSLGSQIVHPPQEFPQYYPGYYAMFWLDPEGFMLEVVCHREKSSSEETVGDR